MLVGLGTVYATLNMPNKKNEGKEGKKRTPAHEQRLIKGGEKRITIFFFGFLRFFSLIIFPFYTSNMTGLTVILIFPMPAKDDSFGGVAGNTSPEVPSEAWRFAVSRRDSMCFSRAALSTFRSKFMRKQKPVKKKIDRH